MGEHHTAHLPAHLPWICSTEDDIMRASGLAMPPVTRPPPMSSESTRRLNETSLSVTAHLPGFENGSACYHNVRSASREPFEFPPLRLPDPEVQTDRVRNFADSVSAPLFNSPNIRSKQNERVGAQLNALNDANSVRETGVHSGVLHNIPYNAEVRTLAEPILQHTDPALDPRLAFMNDQDTSAAPQIQAIESQGATASADVTLARAGLASNGGIARQLLSSRGGATERHFEPWASATDFTNGTINGDLLRSANPVWAQNSGHRSCHTQPLAQEQSIVPWGQRGQTERDSAHSSSRKRKAGSEPPIPFGASEAVRTFVLELPDDAESLRLLASLCGFNGDEKRADLMRAVILKWRGCIESIKTTKAEWSQRAAELLATASTHALKQIKSMLKIHANASNRRLISVLADATPPPCRNRTQRKQRASSAQANLPSITLERSSTLQPTQSGAVALASTSSPVILAPQPVPQTRVDSTANLSSAGSTELGLRHMPDLGVRPRPHRDGPNIRHSSRLPARPHLMGARGMVTPSPWFAAGTVARAHFRVLNDLLGFGFQQSESAFDRPLQRPVAVAMFAAVDLALPRRVPRLLISDPHELFSEARRASSRDGAVDVQLRCRPCAWDVHPKDWKFVWPFPSKALLHAVPRSAARAGGTVSQAVELSQALRYTNGKISGTDRASSLIKSFEVAKRKAPSIERIEITLERGSGATQYDLATHYIVYVQSVLLRSTAALMHEIGQRSLSRFRQFERERLEGERTHFRELSEESTCTFAKEVGMSVSDATAQFAMERHEVRSAMVQDAIEIDCIRLNLKCPLSLMRVRTPARGARCRHIQCFDLESFLEYSRKSYSYTCPVCNQPNFCHPDELVIALLFLKGLQDFVDADELELLPNGSFRIPAAQQGPPQRSIAPSNAKGNDHAGIAREKEKFDPALVAKRERKAALDPTEVIDLTTNDSDDDKIGVGEEGGEGHPTLIGASGVLQDLDVNDAVFSPSNFYDLERDLRLIGRELDSAALPPPEAPPFRPFTLAGSQTGAPSRPRFLPDPNEIINLDSD